MSKRILSILFVALSATLFLTACKVGGKTTAVTMEEFRNTDLSRMIIPDSILTNPDYCSQKDEFMFIEKTSEFEPIGYRGRDFQRFYIHYDSVRFMGNGVYKVEGRTRYRDTIRLFSGTITLDSMRLNKGKHLPSTGKFGKLCGHYQFDEDEFSGGGVLTGKMTIDFVKVNGRFYYDAFMLGVADGYDNRQYEGVWTSKDLTRMEKCNWGDFRIPDSQGLDIGAGEFSPVDEHSGQGWQVYTCGWAENDSLQAIYQANMQWFTHEEDYVIPYSGRLQRYLKEYGHGKSQPSAKVVLGTIPATMEEFNVWYEMGAMENDYLWPLALCLPICVWASSPMEKYQRDFLTITWNYKRNTLPFSTNTANNCRKNGIRHLNGGRKRCTGSRDTVHCVSTIFCASQRVMP